LEIFCNELKNFKWCQRIGYRNWDEIGVWIKIYNEIDIIV
jgi:hypothetical protein